MLTDDELKKMRVCAPLLPDPGPEVAIQLLDEVERLRAEYKRLCATLPSPRQVTDEVARITERIAELQAENVALRELHRELTGASVCKLNAADLAHARKVLAQLHLRANVQVTMHDAAAEMKRKAIEIIKRRFHSTVVSDADEDGIVKELEALR